MEDEKTLLIVDDDKPVRQSICAYFEDQDYLILEADNGESALEIFTKYKVDMILADLRMPKINGLELLTIIKEKSPDTPVIILSGTGVIADAIEALHRGAWDYLLKPITDLTILLHAVEKNLERAKLIVDNRNYRKHLEEIIETRTKELQQTNTALRESEWRLEQAITSTKLGTWDWDIINNQITCNKCCQEILDLSPSQKFNIDNWKQMIHEQDRQHIYAQLDNLLIGNTELFQAEYRININKQTTKWIKSNLKIVEYDPKKQPRYLIGTHMDITERKLSEKKLQENEKRFRLLVEHISNIAIQGYDHNHHIIFWNQASESLYGYTKEEAMGKTMEELLVKQTEQQHSYHDFEHWLKYPNQYYPPIERILLHKNGSETPIYSSHVVLKSFNSHTELYCFDVDLSKQINAEKERRKLETKILSAEKLESLGRMAGGIAHDFNNLLMTILGNAEITLEEIPDNTSNHNSIKEIQTAGKRAAELCNQMLIYSGKKNYIANEININKLITDIKPLFKVSTKKIDINYNLNDNPIIYGDINQIKQLFISLITNAIEAIDNKHGTITITTGTIRKLPKQLKFNHIPEEDPNKIIVFISVKDTGCGMLKEHNNKIFEPFFSTKFTGRGLGLAAAQGIIKGHKGALELTTKFNIGSTFTIYFPANYHHATQIITPKKQQNIKHGTTLVIDDEEPIRMICKYMLKKLGFKVITASNGHEAMAQLEKYKEEINLIILDLSMPDMDGVETFTKLREIDTDCKIIISSGFNERMVYTKFNGKKFDAFIQKPYQIHSLRKIIKKVLTPESL